MKTILLLALILLALFPYPLVTSLAEMSQCSPAGFVYVLQYTRVFVFWDNIYGQSTIGGVTWVPAPRLSNYKYIIMTLIHEARHHYQRTNPFYWNDLLNYNRDRFARFRIESDAINFTTLLITNC